MLDFSRAVVRNLPGEDRSRQEPVDPMAQWTANQLQSSKPHRINLSPCLRTFSKLGLFSLIPVDEQTVAFQHDEPKDDPGDEDDQEKRKY